ncbi:MAG: hypothetical protein ABIT35_01405 [Chitinophagaceae bacterium]
MHLNISPTLLISDVQKEFNDIFPFLKLEFFNTKSFSRNDFSASQIIPKNRKLGEGQTGIKDDIIEIGEEMKVSVLENIFRDKFKLAVQVFRKSGNLWLETTMTDSWSLLQQNNHGREISTKKDTNMKPDDFDLTRDANQ